MASEVRVGVQLHPVHASAGELQEAWRHAEALGVDSVWTWDHFLPTYGPVDGASYECWSLLAAMAATTRRVRIGSLVSPVGYRNPSLLAHVAQTVDALSGGRLTLGVGAGWLRRDYVRNGYEFPLIADRLDQLEQAVVMLHDRFGSQTGRGIPLLVGGGGVRRTLPLTARYAHMWNGFGDPAWFAQRNAALTECCRRIGRPPEEIERSVLVDARRGDLDWDAYRRAGAQHLIVGLGAPFDWAPVEALLEWARAASVR